MKDFSWIAALALCCFVPLSACDSGGGVKEAEEPAQRRSTADAQKKKKKSDFVPVSEKGKKWGGWRWKGKSDDCFYVAKNRCFTELKPACAAAKCGDKACESYGAAPISVICEGDKRPKVVRDDGDDDDDDDDGDDDAADDANPANEKKSSSKSSKQASGDKSADEPKKTKPKKTKRKKTKRKKKSER